MFLRSSDEQRATELREAHRERVARNGVRISPLWAQPCRAYNVHIGLDPRARSALAKVQRGLHQAEPGLLACPRDTLHVSVAWLLAVHASYGVGKDALWERHGKEWTAQLGRIAAQSAAFGINYGGVVATDSAVVALARPSEPVNRIRRTIRERLRLPPQTRNEADLVHTTLFRYRAPLRDPDGFLAVLEGTSADAAAEVEELVVCKELVYPSLEAQVLGRLPLASRGRRADAPCGCG